MTIRIRRDTAANWTAQNSVLADGQLGYETNTGRIKIGNGVTAWTALDYRFETSAAAWGSIAGTLSAQTDLNAALNGKQANLVSGTNIKTVGGISILGAGDIPVSGGGGSVAWGDITGTLSAQTDLQAELDGKQPLATVLTNTTASFTAAQETKLSGIATGATANAADAFLLSRDNHTGTQAAATITGLAPVATSGSAADLSAGTLPAARFDDTAHGVRAGGTLHANAVAAGAAGFMTGADKTKLDGVATGATANATDAALRDRATHTGTQLASTISDFSTAVAATAAVTANTAKVTNATHTGDVTGSGALTIAADAVTNVKLANMATSTIKGRLTAGTGDPEDLTPAQVRTLINVADGAQVNVATDLAYTSSTRLLASSTGADVTLPVVGADAGLMTAADKTKLDGIAAGAQVNVPTNLSYTAATRVVASDTGADATLPLFTSGDAGLAPASGGGTTNFLRADGTWAVLGNLALRTITISATAPASPVVGDIWVDPT